MVGDERWAHARGGVRGETWSPGPKKRTRRQGGRSCRILPPPRQGGGRRAWASAFAPETAIWWFGLAWCMTPSDCVFGTQPVAGWGGKKNLMRADSCGSLHSHNPTGRLTTVFLCEPNSCPPQYHPRLQKATGNSRAQHTHLTPSTCVPPPPGVGMPTVLHIDGRWRSSWPTPQVAGVLEVSQLPGASETRTELLQSVVATSAAATPSEAACAKRHGRIKTDDCRHGASGSQFGEGRCSRRC
eukprot:scaffold22679_cov69-Phaeocystis_antarctica.AAC.4